MYFENLYTAHYYSRDTSQSSQVLWIIQRIYKQKRVNICVMINAICILVNTISNKMCTYVYLIQIQINSSHPSKFHHRRPICMLRHKSFSVVHHERAFQTTVRKNHDGV